MVTSHRNLALAWGSWGLGRDGGVPDIVEMQKPPRAEAWTPVSCCCWGVCRIEAGQNERLRPDTCMSSSPGQLSAGLCGTPGPTVASLSLKDMDRGRSYHDAILHDYQGGSVLTS